MADGGGGCWSGRSSGDGLKQGSGRGASVVRGGAGASVGWAGTVLSSAFHDEVVAAAEGASPVRSSGDGFDQGMG